MKKTIILFLSILMCLNTTMMPVMAEDGIVQEEPIITNDENLEEADLALLLEEISLISTEDIKEENIETIKEKIIKIEEKLALIDEEELLLYDLEHYYEVKDYIDNYITGEIVKETEEYNEEEHPTLEENEIIENEQHNNNQDEGNDVPPLNYITPEFDEEKIIHRTLKKKFLQTTTTLPKSYSLVDKGYVSPIKLQNPYGSCWAFAAIASAESNYLLSNNITTGNIDLSEMHLAWFAYSNYLVADPLNLIKYDGTFVPSSFANDETNNGISEDYKLQIGGNSELATFSLASGIGLIDENDLPYVTDPYQGEDFSIPNSDLCYTSDYILTSSEIISLNEIELIKKTIMQKGAVAISYYHYTSNIGESIYFGSNGISFYSGDAGQTQTNHAVTIVGWNDDYPRENFSGKNGKKPSSNGAWLIKNSWGDYFGDDGYFWISYEEPTLRNDHATSYTIEKVEPDVDLHIYQYDGGSYGYASLGYEEPTVEVANIYTAQRDELLTDVGIFCENSQVDYEIDIYTGIEYVDDGSDPVNGTNVHHQEGTIDNAGYHLIHLTDPVYIDDDDKFSIVVSYADQKGNSIGYPYDCDYTYSGGYHHINDTSNDRSYIASPGYDFERVDNDLVNPCSMRIKAVCREKTSLYKVEHYYENGAGEYEVNIETKPAIAGVTVEAIKNTLDDKYVFDEDNPLNVLSGEVLDDNSLVLKVYYDRQEYTITYNTAGGNDIDPVSYKWGYDIVPPEDPQRKGYSFAGWNPEIPDTMPLENLEVTAIWELINRSITYKLNGGKLSNKAIYDSSFSIETQSFDLPSSSEITKTGYNFNGWYLDSEYTKPIETYLKNDLEQDVTLYAKWTIKDPSVELDTPSDLSVYLDDEENIIIHTDDSDYINNLVKGDTEGNVSKNYISIYQGKWFSPGKRLVDGLSAKVNNNKWTDEQGEHTWTQIEKIDNYTLKATPNDSISNVNSKIILFVEAYKKSPEYEVVFTKQNKPAPESGITYSYQNNVLKVFSNDNEWLRNIKRLTFVDADDNSTHFCKTNYFTLKDGYIEAELSFDVQSDNTTILNNKDYHLIVSQDWSTWWSSNGSNIQVGLFDSDVYLGIINTGTNVDVTDVFDFNSLPEYVEWTFKCEDNKFIIESECEEWLDRLAGQDDSTIGIIFYPSETNTFSLSIKNDSVKQPIKKGNGCVYITDADLKSLGIYKGLYNAIYFDEVNDFNYCGIQNTFTKTSQKYGTWGYFEMKYGNPMKAIPSVTVSEGSNGSLVISCKNTEFLNNLMYIRTFKKIKDNYKWGLSSSKYYYPSNYPIVNNSITINDLGLGNGTYDFELFSYGFSSDFDYNKQLIKSVTFNNALLKDIPDDCEIVQGGSNYYIQTNDADYLNAYDSINSTSYVEYEYYRYYPQKVPAYGSGMGMKFFEEWYSQEKIDGNKIIVGSFDNKRKKFLLDVPGYKTLEIVDNNYESTYVFNDIEHVETRFENNKLYIYSDKLQNIIDNISYNNTTDNSMVGGFTYGDNEEDWLKENIELLRRNMLTEGSDDNGDYLCIDLNSFSFINIKSFSQEPWFVCLEPNHYSGNSNWLSFCINRPQYFINYHDELLNTFMARDDYKFYYVGNKVTLKDLYNKNYIFEGWYTKDGTNGDWGEKLTVIDNIIDDIDLYAKWSPKNLLSSVYSNLNNGDTVEKGTTLSLFTNESGAEIRYTTDGNNPTSTSSLYTEPIILTENITIKANVYKEGKVTPDNPFSITITVNPDLDDTEGTDDEESDNQTEGLWTNDISDFVYDPSIKKYTYEETDLRVYSNKTLLTLNKDYSVSYKNNTKAGTATLTITGKGNYAGTLVKEFVINPISLTSSNTEITLNKDLFKTNNKAQKPTVSSVIYTDGDGKEYKLKNNTDYTVSYSNASSKDEGNYQVSIIGKGNYSTTNDLTKDYTITNKTLVSSLSISGIKNTAYTGEEITFDITIKNGKTVLSNDEIASNFEIEYGNNTSVGTATVTITAKDNTDYEGSVTKTFKITGTNISKATYSKLEYSSYVYTGDPFTPVQTLSYKKSKTESYELVSNITNPVDYDYTVEYQNNINIGTATIIYTGNPAKGYEGTKKVTFKITGTALSKTKFELNSESFKSLPNQTYTGEEIKIDGISLYYQSNSKDPSTKVDLEENSDYTVSYSNNINVGTATITFTGINGYTGAVKKTFKITAKPLTDGDVAEIDDQTYLKGGVKPDVVVESDGTPLVLNKDYTVSYKNNTAVNDNTNPKKQTTVTIKGKGNYSGTITKNFTITPKNINEVSITVPDKVYSNKANIYKSTPTLIDSDGKKLAAGTDYDKNIIYTYKFDTLVTDTSVKPNKSIIRLAGDIVNPKDIIPVNTVIQVQINTLPNKNYTGSITSTFRIIASDISKASITIPAQYYKGKSIELSKSDLTVKLGKEILSLSDYEIVSYDNNTNKGSASLTIKGKGNYGGVKTVKFSIQSRTLGHTIIFNSNGGTGTMKDQIITKNTTITANSFKKAGYTFKGWSTTQNGSVEYSNKQSFTYNPLTAGLSTTLYAVWE